MAYSPTTWNTGDNITATKLNNLESGVGAAIVRTGDTMTGTLTIQQTMSGTAKDTLLLQATDGKIFKFRLNTDNTIELRNATDSHTMAKFANDGSQIWVGDTLKKVWHQGNQGSGSGLDADTVDTYNVGNSANQIALNNGTKCTNLNADLLDGIDSTGFLQLSGFSGKKVSQQTTAPSSPADGDWWVDLSVSY